VLARVEHDQSGAVPEGGGDGPDRIGGRAGGRAERGGSGERHEVVVVDGVEVDEPGRSVRPPPGQAHRQRRLAGAAGTGQRDQPDPLEELPDPVDVAVASDQFGERRR
jgi:hypothetical protein